MSARPADSQTSAETIGGLLASVAIFAELAGVAYRPLRLIPFAVIAAIVATAIGGRYLRLAGLALGLGALCFVAGMTVAVLTNHPLW